MKVIEWIWENWELIGICFGILVNAMGLIYNIYKMCANGKLKALQHAVTLAEAARAYELEAEAFEGYNSAEKLNYVLSRLRVLAAELGCTYNETELVRMIEDDISFSKGVNAVSCDTLE